MAEGRRLIVPPDAERHAVVVIDLGFGDAGKGLVVDHLTRTLGATAVVRFNGGAQAGHNVVTPDGRHHTFAQIGAGSFVPGVRTWIGSEVITHPSALVIEARHLERRGVPSPLTRIHVHGEAPVITPYDQALGRLRELARGGARHGSCGVGVGEVAADLRLGAAVIRVEDLRDRAALSRRLAGHRERKLADGRDVVAGAPRSEAVEQELGAFDPSIAGRWTDAVTEFAAAVHIEDAASWRLGLARHRRVVFEGAQGVLLDRDHGFFPHTSPGDCTVRAAQRIAADIGVRMATVGVLRSYTARHGPGPLPGELRPAPAWASEAHNVTGPWQGPVRAGFPDLVFARYAIANAGARIDGLAMTHADRVSAEWAWVEAHEIPGAGGVRHVTRLASFSELTLEQRARETALLSRARPCLRELRLARDGPGGDLARRLGDELGVTPAFVSYGPSSGDVKEA